jgi:hypothetical protein
VLRTKSVNHAYCVSASTIIGSRMCAGSIPLASTARGSVVPPAGSHPSLIENRYSASSPIQNDGAAVLK